MLNMSLNYGQDVEQTLLNLFYVKEISYGLGNQDVTYALPQRQKHFRSGFSI